MSHMQSKTAVNVKCINCKAQYGLQTGEEEE